MKITRNTVVTLRQRVMDCDGAVIDGGEHPISYVHGGYQDIFARIEQALDGKEAGETVSVRLEPEDAFGAYDPDLVVVAGLDQFEEPPDQGDMVEQDLGKGMQVYRVTEVRDDAAVLDGNHPLAGRPLNFLAEIMDVRPAQADELARVAKTVTAGIDRWRAAKMAATQLTAPAIVLLIAAVLIEAIGTGWLLYLLLLFLFAVLLDLLWKGANHIRDMFRTGEVLRVDVTGFYWHAFGHTVPWGDIARIQFKKSFGVESWYSVTLTDGRSFKLYTHTLSVDPSQISCLLAHYLPATKLAGI